MRDLARVPRPRTDKAVSRLDPAFSTRLARAGVDADVVAGDGHATDATDPANVAMRGFALPDHAARPPCPRDGAAGWVR